MQKCEWPGSAENGSPHSNAPTHTHTYTIHCTPRPDPQDGQRIINSGQSPASSEMQSAS